MLSTAVNLWLKRWNAALWLVLTMSVAASAQPTPSQRRQAARSYDEGRVQFRSGEYAQAAQSFMAAFRLAPSRNALIQAVLAYGRAEQLDRAGTLGLFLAEQYNTSDSRVTDCRGSDQRSG